MVLNAIVWQKKNVSKEIQIAAFFFSSMDRYIGIARNLSIMYYYHLIGYNSDHGLAACVCKLAAFYTFSSPKRTHYKIGILNISSKTLVSWTHDYMP